MKVGERFNPYKVFNGVFIPEALCCVSVKDLSHGAKITYGRFLRYAGMNGYAFPKRDTVAKEIGASWRSVDEYIDELVVFGLLEKIRRGKKRSNIYYFLWHDIFTDKNIQKLSELQNSVTPYELQNSVTPYEESHYKRIKGNFSKKNSSLAEKNNHERMEYVDCDPESGEPMERRQKARKKAEPKNKVALRIRHKFVEMVHERFGFRPAVDVKSYVQVLKAMNSGGLTEDQIYDLFDEWFGLPKKDDDLIQIMQALSTYNINRYKVNNL